MLHELERLNRRFLEIESLLNRSETLSDNRLFQKLSKERASLLDGVKLFHEMTHIEKQIKDSQILLAENDDEIATMAREELKSLQEQKEKTINEIRIYLLPKDPNDDKNIFLEIRAGAGGDEASLFAAELFRAYTRYCESRRWKVEIMSFNENELGGYKEIIAQIIGQGVYQKLKYESGTHRVQRVPQTETQGRVHTSTVTVAIMPEADEIDEVDIKDADLRIDTYRASGAGGQHINRTDSAVRLTHIPTGIVVACQDERSQIKNKARAMSILKAKIYESALMEKEKLESEERRALVGRGDRSERIRTYNFPQSRITDHRVNYTTHALDAVMEGNMEDIFTKLFDYYQTQLLASVNTAGLSS